jgi:hypothetical protein
VERWFAEITEQRIRRGVFKNIDELIATIDEFIVCNNENPKPFIWTATPDLILDRVGRLCTRTHCLPHQVEIDFDAARIIGSVSLFEGIAVLGKNCFEPNQVLFQVRVLLTVEFDATSPRRRVRATCSRPGHA